MPKSFLTTDQLVKIRDEHFSTSTLDKTVTMWGYYLQGAQAAACVLNTWIPVTERWPDPLQRVMFIVDLPGRYEHGKQYGGTYVGDAGHERPYRQNGFATPGVVYPASHWLPIPESPVKTDDNNQTIQTT